MPAHSLPELPAPPTADRIAALAEELARRDPTLTLIHAPAELARLSRDYHD